jgi:nucleoside-diphosphate-sugar epimerase
MRVLIMGCGYVGIALGKQLLERGHEVHGVRRTEGGAAELAAQGIQPRIADASKPADLMGLPAEWDWVVNSIAASGSGGEGYRSAYLEATRSIIRWLVRTPPKKYVYTSSTGVYAQDDGSLVTEMDPADPTTETGRVLIETEQELLQAFRNTGFPAMILRIAGIYGPGRGYWLRQFLAGEARLEGRGERHLNMVHRDDVAGAIVAALEKGRAGEIYNVCDNEPVSQLECFRWLAGVFGQPKPPSVQGARDQTRRRTATNKRISNRKLRQELGYVFKYPTFREGYTAELQALRGL